MKEHRPTAGLHERDAAAIQATYLPDGKTCFDCAHVFRCVALFGVSDDDVDCDFYPSRFRERKPAKPEGRGDG